MSSLLGHSVCRWVTPNDNGFKKFIQKWQVFLIVHPSCCEVRELQGGRIPKHFSFFWDPAGVNRHRLCSALRLQPPRQHHHMSTVWLPTHATTAIPSPLSPCFLKLTEAQMEFPVPLMSREKGVAIAVTTGAAGSHGEGLWLLSLAICF